MELVGLGLGVGGISTEMGLLGIGGVLFKEGRDSLCEGGGGRLGRLVRGSTPGKGPRGWRWALRRMKGGIQVGTFSLLGLLLKYNLSMSEGNSSMGKPGSKSISLCEGPVLRISDRWCFSLKIVYKTC